MTFETTPAHAAIFACIEKGDDNLVLEAVAGSGKTTTIIKSLSLIPKDKSVLFLAFNKSIADKLSAELNALGLNNVQAMTLNALGHRSYIAWRNRLPVRLDTDKVRGIAKELMTPGDFRYYGPVVSRLVRLAKSAGIVPAGVPGCSAGILSDTVDNWIGLIEHFDVDLPDGASDVVIVDFARKVLKESCATQDVIDFDDQLLLTYAYGCPVKQFDWVFVDEAQDLSPLQHELVARAMKPGTGRLVAVGDANQAIYGFRGADSNSMGKLAARFNCKKLPLHVSYRCPQSVVTFAQRYVGHIMAHASAPMGTVDTNAKPFDAMEFKPGDMVVCRFNAPLVQGAYNLLRRRIPCVILGREVGQGLLALIRKLRATDVKTMLDRLSAWETKEAERFRQQDKEEKAAAVHDKAETIRVFAESADSVAEVERAIERMFADKSSDDVVTLSTVHKAKGKEAERVFIINFHEMPCRWAKSDWQQQQEINLIYVAVTRAKSHLGLVVVPKAP